MSLLDFVRSLITPHTRERRHGSRPKAKTAPRAQGAGTPRSESKVVPPVHTTVPPQQPTVQIEVFYCDEATGKQFAPVETITGKLGSTVSLPLRQFPGRGFARAENYVNVFTAGPKPITLYYREVMSAPVTIYHRAENGLLLAPPEVNHGTVNLAFVASALPQYADEVEGPRIRRGVYTTKAQTIRFTYHPGGIETGAVPEAAFVEILQDKHVYPHVRSREVLNAALPHGSIWQVFGLVREESSKHVWLNLGGSQWITSANTRPHRTNPNLPAPITLTNAKVQFTTRVIKLDARGRIVGPPAGCSQWSAPYGQILPEKIAYGMVVQVLAKVIVSDGSAWYHLETGTFIQSPYVSFQTSK